MDPRQFLRVEGFAVLLLSMAGYAALDGSIWLLALLFLAPDLSMLGYLAGPRLGSLAYNVVHTYALPAALGVAGFWTGTDLLLLAAFVWTAHIGADRMFGYGLKFESGFTDTHLSDQPAPMTPLTDAE